MQLYGSKWLLIEPQLLREPSCVCLFAQQPTFHLATPLFDDEPKPAPSSKVPVSQWLKAILPCSCLLLLPTLCQPQIEIPSR